VRRVHRTCAEDDFMGSVCAVRRTFPAFLVGGELDADGTGLLSFYAIFVSRCD
jgi:hypothetical protein